MSPSEVDVPNNMIVLCPTHHRIMDKQTERYDGTTLRRVKAQHEEWVKRRGLDIPCVAPANPRSGGRKADAGSSRDNGQPTHGERWRRPCDVAR
jgi:hypothetical protein